MSEEKKTTKAKEVAKAAFIAKKLKVLNQKDDPRHERNAVRVVENNK